MTFRIIVIITAVAFTNLLLGGCTKIVKRQWDEMGNPYAKSVSVVVTRQGETVKFDRSGGIIDAHLQVVTGVSDKGRPVTIALDDVDHFGIKKAAVVETVLFTALIIGPFIGVGILVSLAGL